MRKLIFYFLAFFCAVVTCASSGGRKPKYTLVGHSWYAQSVQVMGYHGKYAVSGSWDKDVKIWDVENETCVSSLSGHGDAVWSVYLRYVCLPCPALPVCSILSSVLLVLSAYTQIYLFLLMM
jgi:WD40 repeat protein